MRGSGLLIAVALVFAGVVAEGCKRPCETNANCVRTCPCLNENTNQRLNCSVGYRCEGDTGSCEDLHDSQSCDDLCDEYAASARCGVNRCLSDGECTRVLSCPIFDAEGTATGTFFDCTIPFACDQAVSSCDVASSASDTELCNNVCPFL